MLYIVSTPIGNLEDISDRARRVLAEADFVLAEDTRRTGILLKALEIEGKRLISFHEHSNPEKLDWLIDQISNGEKTAAYVSDAGVPNLSDPGGKLVEAALERNIKVVPIPGPSALTTLISVAPFSCSSFQFLGYFPKKKGRQKMIEYIKIQKMPVFFFESPHRIVRTLEFLAENLPGFKVLIARELTKVFEQITYSKLTKDMAAKVKPKGEFIFALVRAK